MYPSHLVRTAMSCVVAALIVFPAVAQTVTPLGAGSYFASPPAGAEVPADSSGAAVLPRIVPGFVGPVQTNKWWSSIIWPRYPGNNYGQVMHPNPLSLQATATGLDIASPRTPVFNATDYYFQFNNQTRGLSLSVAGMTSADLRVESAGDWSVKARWTAAGGRTLRATFGRGMPFVYAEVTGGDAMVTFNTAAGAPVVWANRGHVLGVTIGAAPYAIFAPVGTTWTIQGNVARNSLGGLGYFSAAALPAATTAALDLFQAHAFAFVTDTRATWTYDQAGSAVNAGFEFVTEAKDGGQTTPLIALYRHHWLNSTLPTTGLEYPSARGTMKLAAANQFTAALPFRGLLPTIPDVGGLPQAELYALVNEQYQLPSLNGAADTYGAGRSYGKVSTLLDLANQAGHTAASNRFLSFLKQELSEWLTAGAIGNGRSAFENIEAESFNQSQGVVIGPVPGGQGVLDVGGGDYLRFDNVEFTTGTPATRLLLRYASTTTGSGLLELHLDSVNGPVIAGGGVGGTGGAWIDLSLGLGAAASGLTGVRTVYLTCTTPYTGELFRLDWFRLDRGAGTQNRSFAYHAPWNTLIGYPSSYGSATELNDHHFHYGYFIFAAAAVAQVDPDWASQSQYGAMIDLLIRDAANWDRTDTRFPFLRNFDPYAGHSQASGHAGFASGNNQESSSEAINFAAGVALWGATTGDTTIRDLGLYLYASESAAIQQYWFDADNAVYPAAAPKKFAGIVWDSGIAYGTWFSAEPEMIHGINFLPITPASLHLATHPSLITKSWNIMTAARGGPPIYWQAVHWPALAMANPTQALALLNANPGYVPEAPETKAQMVHWIKSMNALGTLDPSITADSPHYAAFTKAGARTLIAWNPGQVALTVRFSTGQSICVQPGQTAILAPGAASTVCGCAADFNHDGTLSVQDIFDFLAAYFGQDPNADFNNSGSISVQDIFDFLAAYFEGC